MRFAILYMVMASIGILMTAILGNMIYGSHAVIRAAMNRAPNAPYRWYVAKWPLNAVLFADQLSAEGLRYRRRYLGSLKWFAILVGCLLILVGGLALYTRL